MKRFITVFQFELMSYIKNKSFMITTVLVAVLLGAATFLPRFIDMSDMLGIPQNNEGTEDSAEQGKEETAFLGLVDEKGYFADMSILEQAFPNTQFVVMDSEKDLRDSVEKEEVEAGFYVADDINYRYYVLNRDMSDERRAVFDELLGIVHKQV